ncbi:MAG: type I phosphomannose isomerase catalytic subunit [Bacteroidales bacterium]
MSSLYPLKFIPLFREKVWGGTRMSTLLGKDFAPLPNCGESWELSGVDGNESLVANGFLKGNTINELAEVYMGDLLGDQVYSDHGISFPLLFKFLDTCEPLSIQVHPGDAIARERHNCSGKAEMWYVLEADPGAELLLGFNKDTDPGEYLHHLQNKTLPQLLRREKVKPGDVFYIPPGQVHGIGAGITLCEIQQSSDITYRLFDWDRGEETGKARKLHVEEAMDVIDFNAGDLRIDYPETLNRPVDLVKSRAFTTRLINFDSELESDYVFVDSFVVYMCIRGSATISFPGGKEKLSMGETVLLPAELNNVSLIPDGFCSLLETYLPARG